MRRRSAAILLATTVVACGGGDGGSVEAFCTTARTFVTDNPATVFDRYDQADPTAAAELLREAAARLQAWADESPGDVDDDVEVLADVALTLADDFEEPTRTPDRAAELEAQFAGVEAASGRVTAFARERCSVELDVGAGGGDVSSTSSTTAAP